MKLAVERIKSILIVSGILVFIGSILFTSNLNSIKFNGSKNYSSIASNWSKNILAESGISYAKRASDWSSGSDDRSYADIASTWSGNVYKATNII